MSNTQVGNIYSQIISDVIDSSRVDFEEGGVDDHVLEELRLGWQQKLSQLQVAAFPWDPKPEPTPAMSNPPTVPSNAMHYPQSMGTPPIQQNQGGLPLPQMNNAMGNQARIKTEPGVDSPGMNPNGQPQQPYQNGPPPSVNAADRAAAHLHMNYGPRASASINAIQSSRQQAPNGQQQQQQPPMTQQQQYQMMQQQRAANGMQQAQARGQQQVQGQGQPSMTPEQYKQMIARQTAGQMQHIAANGHNAQNSVGGAQTDGTGDEVEGLSVIKQFGPNGEELSMGRVEIDNLLRSKIEAMGQRMEGGGLMLPLKQASTSKSRKIKAKSSHPVDSMIQVDGGDDDDDTDVKDEDVDEDAINSDLDDPDDNVNDEEDDDEGMGHIMLCMYDKVQRVKNKWKCVMKDGVLTVNGKEYVFHKASGEYEW